MRLHVCVCVCDIFKVHAQHYILNMAVVVLARVFSWHVCNVNMIFARSLWCFEAGRRGVGVGWRWSER